MEAVDRIGKARVQLNRLYPFFGYLTMSLNEQEYTPEQEEGFKAKGQKPTMAVTEDRDLYFSEEFINSLSDEELEKTMVHEVLHLVLNHHKRLDKLLNLQGGSRQAGNIAADVKVNHVLWQEGIPLNPDDEGETVEINAQGNCDLNNLGIPVVIEDVGEKSLEQIYKIILESQEKQEDDQEQSDADQDQPQSSDTDQEGSSGDNSQQKEIEELDDLGSQGSFDNHIINDKDDNNFEEHNEDFEEKMSKASQQVEPSDLPQAVDDKIEDISKGEEINWKQVLQRKVSGGMTTDHDWMSPSRKGRATGHYMPSPEKQGLKLTVVVDTSGSVKKENLMNYLGEVQSICQMFSNVTVNLIQHTTKVTDEETFNFARSSDFEDIEIKGRGGTDHRPVFEHIDKMTEKPDQVVLFTDAESYFPDQAPSYDVLWAVDNDYRSESKVKQDIPFGRVETIKS